MPEPKQIGPAAPRRVQNRKIARSNIPLPPRPDRESDRSPPRVPAGRDALFASLPAPPPVEPPVVAVTAVVAKTDSHAATLPASPVQPPPPAQVDRVSQTVTSVTEPVVAQPQDAVAQPALGSESPRPAVVATEESRAAAPQPAKPNQVVIASAATTSWPPPIDVIGALLLATPSGKGDQLP